MDRDMVILEEVGRWRFLLGRHVVCFCGFASERTCNRRLKLLVEAKYLKREKILYGVPYLYKLAHRGRVLIGFNKREENIRVDRIGHDIKVLDCVSYILNRFAISLDNIKTEKELHMERGFSNRRHEPDFVFTKDGSNYAVEVELTLKAKDKLLDNIKTNFINYDFQIWIIGKNGALKSTIKKASLSYPNIEIIDIGGIKNECN